MTKTTVDRPRQRHTSVNPKNSNYRRPYEQSIKRHRPKRKPKNRRRRGAESPTNSNSTLKAEGNPRKQDLPRREVEKPTKHRAAWKAKDYPRKQDPPNNIKRNDAKATTQTPTLTKQMTASKTNSKNSKTRPHQKTTSRSAHITHRVTTPDYNMILLEYHYVFSLLRVAWSLAAMARLVGAAASCEALG